MLSADPGAAASRPRLSDGLGDACAELEAGCNDEAGEDARRSTDEREVVEVDFSMGGAATTTTLAGPASIDWLALAAAAGTACELLLLLQALNQPFFSSPSWTDSSRSSSSPKRDRSHHSSSACDEIWVVAGEENFRRVLRREAELESRSEMRRAETNWALVAEEGYTRDVFSGGVSKVGRRSELFQQVVG